MTRLVRILFFLTGLVLLPAAVFAQATIAGVVKDASGGVLPGVTVEVSSPALIEKVRTATTDGNGQYSIIDLRPGTYAVVFTLPGFSTVRREGIELAGSFAATVNTDLRVGNLEETVTVTGESPVVDTQNTRRQQTLSGEVIAATPTGNRYQNLLAIVPGVVISGTQDVGGSRGDTPTDVSVHGSSINDGRLQIDGGNVAVPQKGGGHDNMFVVDTINAQEVVVTTAGGLGEADTAGVTINMIPREGGNTFSGQIFTTGTSGSLQSDNFTTDLQARGLPAANSVKKLWDVSVGFGGPIVKDRVWFFATGRYNGFRNNIAGLYLNKNANNPNAWTYEPDLAQQAISDGTWRMAAVRSTVQLTPRNKFALYWDEQYQCRFCIGGNTGTITVEATGLSLANPSRVHQVGWKSPISSRLLAEAQISTAVLRWGNQPRREDNGLNMIAAVDQGGIIPGLAFRSFTYGSNSSLGVHGAGSLTFVTGTHSLKVGFLRDHAIPHSYGWNNQNLSYRLRNGVPNQLTQFVFPLETEVVFDPLGLYVQDTWQVGRLSLQGGVRYDQNVSSFRAQQVGPAQFGPTVLLPAEDGANFKDITPRAAFAYNLFGNGKTAVKASLGKYNVAQDGQTSLFGRPMGRIGRIVTSTTRGWTDTNQNYVPDCDLRSPVANGECAAMANRLFGTTDVQTNYDPAITKGWGVRPYNWEFSTSIQQELIPRVAVSAAYHRRWFGNFTVIDNLAVTPADFSRYTVTASDPRLPGGAVTIDNLYDVSPAKFGLVDQLVTSSDRFGKQIQRFDGVDLTLAARMPNGTTVQGGLSTGTSLTDTCDVTPKMDSPSTLYCRTSEGATRLRLLGSYTIPRVDVQVAGSFQSNPGPVVAANFVAANALVAPSLGRPLAGGAANVTVNLVEPFTMRGDRLNQLDVRLAKIVTVDSLRVRLGIDFFNALNSSVVQLENATFTPGGTWRVPTLILDARLIKFSAQLNF